MSLTHNAHLNYFLFNATINNNKFRGIKKIA